MKGIISFSLFGSESKFFHGVLTNLELCGTHYPECDIIVFADRELAEKLQKYQKKYSFKLRQMPDSKRLEGMFWRFYALKEPDYDFYIFRDADSRITKRESDMVTEWIESGMNLHVIRDHPMHNAPILGGMWGIRIDRAKVFQSALRGYIPKGYYGEDQEFIWKYVYRQNRGDMLVHDPYFMRESRSQKSQKFGVSLEYIGESIDQFDQ